MKAIKYLMVALLPRQKNYGKYTFVDWYSNFFDILFMTLSAIFNLSLWDFRFSKKATKIDEISQLLYS